MTRRRISSQTSDPHRPPTPQMAYMGPAHPYTACFAHWIPTPPTQSKSKTRISYMENTPLMFLNSHPPGGI